MVVVREDPHQHHGAGDAKREPEHDRARPFPAERPGQQRSQPGRHAAGREGAGQGDPADSQQLVHVKLQAHTEHQQDHADLGQLFGYPRIGDKARRVGSDHQPCHQVPDDRRQADAAREVSQQQCDGETAGEREDQTVAGHRDI